MIAGTSMGAIMRRAAYAAGLSAAEIRAGFEQPVRQPRRLLRARSPAS